MTEPTDTSHPAGKGDAPRPYDATAFTEGWERIWGKKEKPKNDVGINNGEKDCLTD